MKTQITGILAGATLFAGSAFADIELSNAGMPKLSLSGWVDANYVSSNNEGGFYGTEVDTLALNEVEIDFLFDFGSGLTAQFDLNYVDGATGTDEVSLEQGFFTYSFTEDEDSSLSVTAGRFETYMGLEGLNVVDLYQFSTGLTSGALGLTPLYQDGVRIDYATDMFSLGAAVVDGVYTSNDDHTELGYEVKATFNGVENLTVFAGYANGQDEAANGDDSELINIWASYQIGDLLVAAEYVDQEMGVVETDGWLVMANYSVNDWLGFTARYSTTDVDNGAEQSEYTLAALLKAHDNLGFIIEFRHDEEDVSGDESETIAIEATLTF